MRPRDLEALGFHAVLEALAAHAVSTPGAETCRRLRPARDLASADGALARQWSFFRLLETAGAVPLAVFPDVRESLALAEHEGAIVPGEQLVGIRTVLRQVRAVLRFLGGRLGEFPELADLPRALHPLPELESALSRMLDETGALVDDASPRLAELRKSLRDLRQEIADRLARMVAADRATEGIADHYVTLRNNRFVVPVKAGAAKQVAGVVQDRSTSGETLFVEPLFAIELNNRMLLLQKEEELEELRLLELATAHVGSVRHELGRTFAALVEVDRLAAGAAFARRFRCTRPAFSAARVDLRAARHPELLLAGRTVTPVDIRIAGDKCALVVSGPNTAGKTVALKTLGLLTLLAQAGVLIPVEEGSTVALVSGLFTDLVDDQSIERDLSTFSSHIVNLVEIFRSLAAPALVLLDEPGAGTDPEEGAALAVALIDRLMAAGTLVAAATHYAPVKLYALNEPRIELAAVDVDPRTFEPRYRLLYGSVGESLGLAMARRLALPAPVLAAAEARRAGSARELAAAIERLETSRRLLEDERSAIEDERRALAENERQSADLLADLRERRRARWSADLEEAGAFLRKLKQEGRATLEIVRRRPPDAARRLEEFARGKQEEIASRAAEFADEDAAETHPPAVGEQVEVSGTAIRGELVGLSGERARIRRGTTTFEVPSAQLRKAKDPRVEPKTAPPRSHGDLEGAPQELNVIGLRAREALAQLERFLDRAQAADTRTVRIVHGLGTGALKRAVAEYLQASPYCTRFHDAEPQQGGAAVTVAELG